MRFILLFCFSLIFLMFGSCASDDTDFITVDFNSPSYIIGSWKMTGSYISPGSGQYYVEETDGMVLEFGEDGTFVTTDYPGCTEATYLLEDDKLTISYNCETFEERFPELNGTFVYSISHEDNSLVLVPMSRMCVEGCSYYYEKTSD